VNASTAAQLSALGDEIAELRRRLVLSRKRRGRLLAIIAQLDLDAEQLSLNGKASSVIADHLEEVAGVRFQRPATAAFVRQVLIPDDIRRAIEAREQGASQR